MTIIGITGGSGCGKTCFSRAFCARGIPRLDADELYHRITAVPSPCTAALADAFGAFVLDENGALSRAALSRYVFAEGAEGEERRARLNRITHRYITETAEKEMERCRAAGMSALVLDAPLLFEAGWESYCTSVVAVLSPLAERVARIMARDGVTEEEARARIAAQPSDDFYRARADHIVMNDGTAAELEAAAVRLSESLVPYIAK